MDTTTVSTGSSNLLHVTNSLLNVTISPYTSNPACHFTNTTCDAPISTSAESIAYTAFMVIVLLASAAGNLMVLLAVMMSSPLRSRVTYHFVLSLACSDFLIAVFPIPFKISMKLHENQFCHSLVPCYIYIITDAIGNSASILNLFLISMDRFVAIKMSFRYQELLSKKRVRLFIVCVWIFVSTWGFVGVFPWMKTSHGVRVGKVCTNDNYYFYTISVFGIYIPVLAAITCMYLAILKIALSQIRAIEAYNIPGPQLLHPDERDNERKHRHQRKRLARELNATKSVAIVYLAYVFCWLPSCVINILIFVNDSIFPDLKCENPKLFKAIFYLFVEILPALNTMINPFIYSFSNKTFRNAFKKVCYKLLRKQLLERHDSLDYSFPASPRMSNRNSSTQLDRCYKNGNKETMVLWKPD